MLLFWRKDLGYCRGKILIKSTPQLMTIHLVTVQSYDGTEKCDLQTHAYMIVIQALATFHIICNFPGQLLINKDNAEAGFVYQLHGLLNDYTKKSKIRHDLLNDCTT